MDYNAEDALKLAGKLALAATMVIGCTNPLELSDRIEQLNDAYIEYDNYITAWTTEKLRTQ